MLHSLLLTPIFTTDCLVMTKIFCVETEAIQCTVLNGRCYLVFVMLASLSNLLILTSLLARSLASRAKSLVAKDIEVASVINGRESGR